MMGDDGGCETIDCETGVWTRSIYMHIYVYTCTCSLALS